MLNFNTGKRGTPIHLDDSTEPAFYIDAGDIKFIEKASALYEEIKKYSNKSSKKVSKIKVDKNGIPENTDEFIEDMKKEFDFILTKLDDLLGEGVTKLVFKGRYSQTLLAEFMEFVSQAITHEREGYLNKYKKKESDIL
jgi:hypothetical protein